MKVAAAGWHRMYARQQADTRQPAGKEEKDRGDHGPGQALQVGLSLQMGATLCCGSTSWLRAIHWPGVNGQQVATSTSLPAAQETCTQVGPDRRVLDGVTPPEFPIRRCPQVGFSATTQRTNFMRRQSCVRPVIIAPSTHEGETWSGRAGKKCLGHA